MGKSWILVLSALLLAGVGPPPGIPGEPPLSPGAESPIAPPTTPHADCVAEALQALQVNHGRLVRAMVTRSKRWGDVWRADFEADGVEPPLVNRLVCGPGALQIAVGQAIAPLPVSPPLSARPSGVRCIYAPFDNPCRGDPVEMLTVCVRPGLYLFPGGRSEAMADTSSLEVAFANRGRAETDAQWAARCAARGGIETDDR